MNQKTISNRIPVTDFEAPELDVYARMNEIQLLNRHEPEKGMFIAESPKVIERAINAGYQPQSFLVDDEHMEADAYRILERCKEIPVYAASSGVSSKSTSPSLPMASLRPAGRPQRDSGHPQWSTTTGC